MGHGGFSRQEGADSKQRILGTRHQGVSCPWSVVSCAEGIEHGEIQLAADSLQRMEDRGQRTELQKKSEVRDQRTANRGY